MEFTLLLIALLPVALTAQFNCSSASIADFVEHLDLGNDQQNSAHQIVQIACTSDSSMSTSTLSEIACQVGHVIVGQRSPSSQVPPYLDSGSSLYINRTRVNWSDNCWQKPTCVIAPIKTREVSVLLKLISLTGTKFAVRSGGHNPNVGFANVDSSGILIDTVNLNQITLSTDKQIVSIGPGVRNGQAYTELGKQGYYVNGGKDPSPAFGGLLLGGGITYLASQYGMAANGLRNVEMVLGNGSIVNANQSHNSDLIWAVKGGGPNYGVVTRYDLEAIPAPKVWYEFRTYNVSQMQALLAAVTKYQDASETDDYSSLVFQSFGQMTIVGFLYMKPVSQPQVFDMFYSIPYQSILTPSTIGSIAELSSASAGAESEDAQMYAGYSVSLEPDVDVYNSTFAAYLGIAAEALKGFNGTVTYGIQPVTSKTAKFSLRNGGLPLNLSQKKQTWFVTTVQWSNPTDNAAAYHAINSVGAAVEKAADAKGIRLPFRFMNDANYQQNVFGSYGSASVQRLQNVAKLYDPQQVFQKLQNNGWLLSKMSQ